MSNHDAAKKRRILITTALPYANGPLHLGYMVEAIQADVWCRFQKLRGHSCFLISGNDAHGTAIMLSAQKLDITPEKYIQQIHEEHIRDCARFYIDFDNFHTTHSPENKALSSDIYFRLKANDDILTRTITQAYDPVENIFLADRFIRGQCPQCKALDQYGDNCEVCGATYDPMQLINPVSSISGAAPIQKESLHYFFKLDKYTNILQEWNSEKHLQPQMVNKLNEWFREGLKQWDISRDAPYFGFEIPDAPGKYFYVWLDAPIGYMAAFKNLCQKSSELCFDDYWQAQSTTELYHFIGKDILYFHALFWPAILHSADFRLPTSIFVHGFLTINGQKMSKSRGTFITVKKYLEHLNPEYLRYYFAAKLNAQVEDIDLNFADFCARVNADLVGKYVNLASRCAGFITKHFNNQLAGQLHDAKLFAEFIQRGETIAAFYDELHFSRAVKEIMALADRANQYIDQYKPWALAKDEAQLPEVHLICTQGLNLFKLLTLYLKPILPSTTYEAEQFLNIPAMTWQSGQEPLLNHAIQTFKPLMQRISEETIEPMLVP